MIIGGVIVAVAVIVVVIGTMLPRDHVATVRARIGASSDSVWQAIADVANQPSWRKDVKRVEMLPSIDGKTAWREHSGNGAIAMVIDRAEAPTHLVTGIADGK